MTCRKSLISFLFVFTALLTACSSKTQVVESPEFSQAQIDFSNNVSVNNIYASLKELSLEPRVAGTKSELQAATFITAQLKMAGYEVEVQPFDFERYIKPKFHELVVEGYDGTLSPSPFQYSVDGHAIGQLIDAGYGLKADYKKLNVKGKIVLVAVKDTAFYELVLLAADSGAEGIILYFPDELEIDNWSLGDEHFDDFIPALALNYKEGTKLLNLIKTSSTINAEVKIGGASIQKAVSQNLIATKQPATKVDDEIVLIGAHYDSVAEAPGASDNASGTAVVIELARLFKTMPTNKEIRFLFFGAEEEGLRGSEKYVSTMSPSEVKRSAAMFNLDMVGSAYAGDLSIQTMDGSDNTATKAASKANETLFGDPIETDFGDRSDHVPFHDAGIDAALFIYDPVEEWYHTPEDTIEKLSKERLQNVAKIVGSSVFEMTMPDIYKE